MMHAIPPRPHRAPIRVVGPALALIALLAAGRADACWQGYESPERLVLRASYLVEVEVLSVSDVDTPTRLWQVPDCGKDARAAVRVVQDHRGMFPVREFEVIGGPYDS